MMELAGVDVLHAKAWIPRNKADRSVVPRVSIQLCTVLTSHVQFAQQHITSKTPGLRFVVNPVLMKPIIQRGEF